MKDIIRLRKILHNSLPIIKIHYSLKPYLYEELDRIDAEKLSEFEKTELKRKFKTEFSDIEEASINIYEACEKLEDPYPVNLVPIRVEFEGDFELKLTIPKEKNTVLDAIPNSFLSDYIFAKLLVQINKNMIQNKGVMAPDTFLDLWFAKMIFETKKEIIDFSDPKHYDKRKEMQIMLKKMVNQATLSGLR